MPLLPDEVTSKTFHRRWGRGYDRRQVEAFLRDVASDYAAAISRVAALAERIQAMADNGSLCEEIDALAWPADAVDSGRADAERDTEVIHPRAEQAAAAVIHQAEESAAALIRHAESLRVEIDQRWERLRAAERRIDRCIVQTDRVLAALRAQVALLNQVDEVKEQIATIRAELQGISSEAQTFANGAGKPRHEPGQSRGGSGSGTNREVRR